MLAKRKVNSGRAGKQMGNGDRGRGAGLGGKFSGELHGSKASPPPPCSAAEQGEGWLAEKWQLGGSWN